jgi:Phytanoyl-CoA dioxygenase (PhyH)
MLSADEIERFRREGYLAVNRALLRAEQMRRLRALIDPLFEDLDAVPPQWVHDLGSRVPEERASIPEVIFTAEVEPRIRFTSSYWALRSVAQELLGAPATISFDHAIVKPAWSAGVTPWHQDYAFNPADTATTVNFWVPLVDVDDRNGCMRFIPYSHRSELAHISKGPDALEAVGVPEEEMVVCPLVAGAFTVHTQRTLHSTGPNCTDTDRLAWVVKFKVDERPRAERLSERARISYRAARRSLHRSRPRTSAPPAPATT